MKFGVSRLVLTVTEKDAPGGHEASRRAIPKRDSVSGVSDEKRAGLRVRVRGGRDESLPFLSRFRLPLKAKDSREPHAARICKLCLKVKDQQDSHLIPRAMYRYVPDSEQPNPQ